MPEKRGPNTEAGLARSSRNAAKHNMTSRENLIPGEDPADLDSLRLHWHNLYPATDPVIFRAVTRAADSEWRLLRITRQLDAQQDALFTKPIADWTDLEHSRYSLAQRYTTAARREHERDHRAILQFLREARAQAREARHIQADALNQPTHWTEADDLLYRHRLRHPDPNQQFDTILSQYAYISVINGVTVTHLTPPNEGILKNLETRFEDTLIERFLQFNVEPPPPEYAWAVERLALRKSRTQTMLLMTGKSFRQAIEAEPEGHIQCWPALEAIDAPIILRKLGEPR